MWKLKEVFLFKFLDTLEILEGKIRKLLIPSNFQECNKLQICKKLLKTYLDTVCFFLIYTYFEWTSMKMVLNSDAHNCSIYSNPFVSLKYFLWTVVKVTFCKDGGGRGEEFEKLEWVFHQIGFSICLEVCVSMKIYQLISAICLYRSIQCSSLAEGKSQKSCHVCLHIPYASHTIVGHLSFSFI